MIKRKTFSREYQWYFKRSSGSVVISKTLFNKREEAVQPPSTVVAPIEDKKIYAVHTRRYLGGLQSPKKFELKLRLMDVSRNSSERIAEPADEPIAGTAAFPRASVAIDRLGALVRVFTSSSQSGCPSPMFGEAAAWERKTASKCYARYTLLCTLSSVRGHTCYVDVIFRTPM